MRRPASRNSVSRRAWVASRLPLPGSARPSASTRQFMEFAVNMPAHDPHVGQADRSTASSSAARAARRPPATSASTASMMAPVSSTLPASMGPPDTKIAGRFRRRAAMSMPGVILSQFDMQTRASAQWALTMYSMASAINSREGRL